MDEQLADVAAEQPDFEIALALAGAISAGAYTAGVLDFLFQALKAWEDAAEPMPRHEVRLRTIAGASAGAITGALGAVALSRGLDPELFTQAEQSRLIGATEGPYEPTCCVLPNLYDAWVVRPSMVVAKGDRPNVAPGNHRRELLGLDDLAPKQGFGPGIRSALNADLLDEIRDAALRPMPRGPFRKTIAGLEPAGREETAPPGSGAVPKLGFLSETIHVYMTVSNLRGIPFDVDFGNATYGMLTHGDRIHYAISGVGSAKSWPVEPWLQQDTVETVYTSTLPQTPTGLVTPEWSRFGEVALASAAFPGGLAPRTISIAPAQYERRQYPLPVDIDQIKAAFPEAIRQAELFTFLNVDGGVVNNTPFDYAEYALMGNKPEARVTDGAKADRAVIMVAPFPEPPLVRPEGTPTPELAAVLRALFPALMNQARFRASELIPVMKENDHSRFMISPRRTLDPREGPARYPIACGLLGGFGGFLDESFRAHDYQLGRRNCQRFLQTTFGLPACNKAMSGRGEGYLSHPTTPNPLKDGKVREREFMIVPLVEDLKREVALLPWPRMSAADFAILMARIKKRLVKISMPFIRAQTDKTSVRLVAWVGLRLQQDRILGYVALAILSDLVRRDQIEGWNSLPAAAVAALQTRDPADDLRELLAVMMSPAGHKATAAQIAQIAHLDPAYVAQALKALADAPAAAPFRTVGLGGERWALQARLPTGWRALPVLRGLFGSWSPARYAAAYR